MKPHCATDSTRGTNKNPVGQRIISAKSLRLKELQNQLADAHYHLNVNLKKFFCYFILKITFLKC